VLKAQCIGSVIVCAATFAAAMVMFKALNAVNLLRVSEQGEVDGFDLDQHGASAYPEFVISSLTASHAVSGTSVGGTALAASSAQASAE
jgi:Amt family ammonium transporter